MLLECIHRIVEKKWELLCDNRVCIRITARNKGPYSIGVNRPEHMASQLSQPQSDVGLYQGDNGLTFNIRV